MTASASTLPWSRVGHRLGHCKSPVMDTRGRSHGTGKTHNLTHVPGTHAEPGLGTKNVIETTLKVSRLQTAGTANRVSDATRGCAARRRMNSVCDRGGRRNWPADRVRSAS